MTSDKGLMQEHLVDDLAVKETNYWWHRIRRNNLVKDLQSHLKQGSRVLEIGCGTGANLRDIKSRGYEVSGLELDPHAIKYCHDLPVLQADATKTLPYSDNSFDAIVILDVLEHLENPNDVVEEMWRILSPEGVLVVMVPADPGLWSYWDEMLGHYRRYTKKTLKESFGECWKVLDLSYSFSWMYFPVKVFRKLKKGKVEEGHTDFVPLPGFINAILIWVGTLENLFQSLIKVPVGTTVSGMWRKVDMPKELSS